MELNRIIEGNCLLTLKSLPAAYVNTCVTSPPYWGLRDYGNNQQLGMEKTPEQFIENLVAVFREVKRVLRDDGTLWVNIGDSYCSTAPGTMSAGLQKDGVFSGITDGTAKSRKSMRPETPSGMKPKDLVGIPWMLAFALRADGWYLRQDIIWSKPNCMPESVTDRCTKSHEYIFMLSKSPRYYYDAESIKTPAINPMDDVRRMTKAKASNKSAPDQERNGIRPKDKQRGHSRRHSGFNDRWDNMTVAEQRSMGANKRSVWTVSPSQFKEAHFATFPEKLIVDCIKAGCPENGVVLDPFMGAGTTALVASKLNRNYLGVELNPEYIRIANKRLDDQLGIFRKVGAA